MHTLIKGKFKFQLNLPGDTPGGLYYYSFELKNNQTSKTSIGELVYLK